MRRGAIILCGGQSTRMGRDKAWLPFGPNETMLQRVARLVGEVVPADQTICVAAPEQDLPTLPSEVRIACDIEAHQGPLAALATGLRSCRKEIDAVFVTGCDTPLLVPTFITRLFDLVGDHDIAAPHDGERWHPLAAVYRTSVLPQIESLIATGKRSLVSLLEAADTRRVSLDEIREADPGLCSLFACNTPADYEAAARSIGVD